MFVRDDPTAIVSRLPSPSPVTGVVNGNVACASRQVVVLEDWLDQVIGK